MTATWFHTQAAALIAGIIIAGFARTYYFAFLFDAPPLTCGARDENEARMAQAADAARVDFRVAAGLGRLWFALVGQSRLFPALLVTSVVAWCFIDDLRKTGRVHRAYWLGGTLIVLSLPLRVWIGYTGPWQTFTDWLVQ